MFTFPIDAEQSFSGNYIPRISLPFGSSVLFRTSYWKRSSRKRRVGTSSVRFVLVMSNHVHSSVVCILVNNVRK